MDRAARLRVLLALSALVGLFGCDGESTSSDADSDIDADTDTDGTGCTDPGWLAPLDDADEDSDDLGCAILSVWGDSRDDVYFAGGSLGIEPRTACALHFDGSTWTRLPIMPTQSFWWVTRTPDGTVWFAGEEGIVVRWADGEATTYPDLADATLFGIWGSSDSDVWAVGGAVTGGERDVILHFDGSEWTLVPPPEVHDVQLFKVWGASADDVWVVGSGGVILHFDGAEWSTHTIHEDSFGGRPQLFTVHGRTADDVWTVGSNVTILHYEGSTWEPYEDPSGEEVFAGVLNGVYAARGGDVFVTGWGGVKIWILEDGTHREETLEGTGDDLHGAWADAEGFAFGVGGNFISPDPPQRNGMIAFRGCEISTDGLPGSD